MTNRSAHAPGPLHELLNSVLLLLVLGMFVSLLLLWAQAGSPAWGATDATPTRPDRPAAGDAALPALFTPEVRHWEADIVRWAAAYDLDPRLVATVMQIESCGDPQAVSSAGARGLFQVMPYHFAADEDPQDPDTNARRGLGYLQRMLAQANGDVRLALAAYNGGPQRLTEPESAWPAETRRYVAWGWGIYQDAQAGRAQSATLEAWLKAGGRALCHQAQARLPLRPVE